MQAVSSGTSNSLIVSAMDKDQKPLRCPRCDSTNTKFCYYNNHSLSEPRHFCKSCKRYWTRGGTLRNVPIGGGCWKNKRIKPCSQTLATITQATSIGSTVAAYQPSLDQKYSGVHSLYMNGLLQQQPTNCLTPMYAFGPQHEIGDLGLGLSSTRPSNDDGTGEYRNEYSMSSSLKQTMHNLSSYYTNTFGALSSSSAYSSSSGMTLSTTSSLLTSRPQLIAQQERSEELMGR